MSFNAEDLPICREVVTGHTLRIKDIDTDIQQGDLMQIISPKSMYHKWIVIFDRVDTNWGCSVSFKFKREDGTISFEHICPEHLYLTWTDFKFKKLNSLEDAEK